MAPQKKIWPIFSPRRFSRFLLVIAIFSPSLLFSQQSDHFRKEKTEIRNLLDSASMYAENDPAISEPMAIAAYQLAESIGDTLSMSEALRLYAVGSQFLHGRDTTERVFYQSMELAGQSFSCQRAKSILWYADFLRKSDGAEKALSLLKPNAGKLLSCGMMYEFMYNIYVIGLCYEKLGQDTNAVFVFNNLYIRNDTR